MKIAVKAKYFLAASLILIAGTAHAVDTGTAAGTQIPGTPAIIPPPMATTAAVTPARTGDKIDLHDEKIPDSVKDVVKHLNASTENVTLDDLNAAREAIARLDALIDIEKRISDLEKLRQDHEGKNSFANAIPSSALNVSNHPIEVPPLPEPVRMPTPISMPAETIDIQRIEGSAGHYTAFIKEFDGTHPVHAGDHISGGYTVVSISSQGVELERGKVTRLVQVKNIQTVFGGAP
jgi:type IV pilus biogenesis protein PilP